MRSFLEFLFLHMSFGDLNYYLIFYISICIRGFLHSSVGKQSACNAGDPVLIPRLGRSPREENGNPPVFLPGEFHGQMSLVSYSPWNHKSWIPLSD